jgi:arginase family enzyme
MMTPLQELAALLRPAGGGLYLVSTGKAEQQALQQRLYGVKTPEEVQQRFLANLERIVSAKGVMLGVPSDVGAGFSRGANLGPQGIRTRLLEDHPDWPQQMERLGLVDLGDVFVVPQLLHDEMLSEPQKLASRKALYPQLSAATAATLPVSPLSIAERAWNLIFELNPLAKPFVIGGDHSNALPVTLALAKVQKQPWGIVQPDAHTDLLPERLGVKYCFATWSWHANEAIGRQGRLTQVGVRASGRDQAHWESTCGVRQFWAKDILADPDGSLDAVIAHLKSTGVHGVYFSNDIDGTDSAWADATGTPEPQGLTPDWVSALIQRLGAEIGLLGGDIMEVAPSLTRTPQSAPRTVGLAARYLVETITAALGTTR